MVKGANPSTGRLEFFHFHAVQAFATAKVRVRLRKHDPARRDLPQLVGRPLPRRDHHHDRADILLLAHMGP